MPVPILLVAGFLGAGKTTVVNHLLSHADGRRIAAVINDFGAINIDAELVAGASDGVVSLSNGCICCSLEGDLLRTLASLLRRDPRPEYIVIETSGVADPTDIVRNLMDPMIWREAPLETVLCVLDATTPATTLADPLLRSQLRAADIVALSKLDLADAQQAISRLAPRLARAKGFFETMEQPGRQFVFQLAGGRATLAPSGTSAQGVPRTRIVFVAEIGRLSKDEIAVVMKACVDGGS
jgi:G3E family GTPase